MASQKINQALEIASLGVNAIGIVGVKASQRYIPNKQRRELFRALEENYPKTERVWVVADPSEKEISEVLSGDGRPSIIQLHGKESMEVCRQLKNKYPFFQWWKALRIRQQEDLLIAQKYQDHADSILLDTWSSKVLGGTGDRLPLEWLTKINYQKPCWIAGGVSAEWIPELLSKVQPFGLDASSKLEDSPGIKDIKKVKSLLQAIKGQTMN